MKTINILSREDVNGIVKEQVDKSLDFVYKELQKLRIRLADIEQAITFPKIKFPLKNTE